MLAAPQIKLPDDSGVTTQLVVTTNNPQFAFSGTVSTSTVDVQINLNGSGWVSDPSFVALSGTSFAVPNPSSYPGGLDLNRGSNTIQLRAIDLTGAVSSISSASIEVVSSLDFQNQVSPPTGLLLRRRARSIDILWSNVGLEDATGFNVYASTGEGGTGTGYLRVNKDLIPSTAVLETVTDEFPLGDVEYAFSDSTDLDVQLLVNTVNPSDGTRVEQKVLNQYPLISSPNYRVAFQLRGLESTSRFSFSHNRNLSDESGILNNDIFGAVSSTSPLFYVVTAVYFDQTTGSLVESRYSTEMAGVPLILDTTIRGIDIREQGQITESYIQEVQKKEPTLSLIPGSTIREIHMEPFSNEVQKVYFLQDFVHRSKSFAALLAIDDPGYTGTSVAVSDSTYKQELRTALATSDDTAVQLLINSAFDSLAENFDVPREGPKPAQVVQTFFTRNRPTRNLTVAQGAVVSSSTVAGAPRFVSKGQTTMYAAAADSYYNNATKRYEIRVQMVAESTGPAGNVPAGSLDSVVAGANGLLTTNEVRAEDGQRTESNLSLAERSSRRLASLDSGTVGGYEKTAISVAGLHNVKIVRSGDTYMMRDWDDVRNKHIGGKVDIWIKGAIERTVSETFAFQFNTARRIKFDVISADNLVFRARDSRLSPTNPIQEMLSDPDQSLGLFNFSDLPTSSYDLTGVTILDYNTIQLSSDFPQPTTRLDDFVEGDYRYRSNNRFTPTVQPVRRVVSVVGETSGPLDGAVGYNLYKIQDPLLEGESTRATDFVSINQVDGVPNGQPKLVNDEAHVLIGAFEESLNSVGVNLFSLAVYSADRSVLYNGPDSSDPDYLIVPGSQTSAAKIVRSENTTILSGSTVSVDYEHDENFVVTYVINDVLQTLQRLVTSQSHATADVLVKQAVENPIYLESTIQLLPNVEKSVTDSAVRTSISILTDSKKTGGSVHQSDFVGTMEKSPGVNYLVQPFSRMTLVDGALRIRDAVAPIAVFVPSLSAGQQAVYMLEEELPFSTLDSGTDGLSHFGVYRDDITMIPSLSLQTLSTLAGQFWIVGRLGAVIEGLSDNATLLAEGFTASELDKARADKVGNHVFISLPVGVLPEASAYTATYTVQGDRGVRDLVTTDVEYLTPGNIVLTYRKA